jgi:hypothetical protein
MADRDPFERPACEPTPRFGFRSVRVRTGEDRFELSAWDSQPFVVLAALGMAGLVPLLLWLVGRVALPVAAVVLVAIASARVALVVTRADAWVEHRVLGVPWRRHRLGRSPTVTSGLVWSWSELSVTPADPALRAPLHDGERAVLLEWYGPDARPETDAARVAALATAEIGRLHDGSGGMAAPR